MHYRKAASFESNGISEIWPSSYVSLQITTRYRRLFKRCTKSDASALGLLGHEYWICVRVTHTEH